MLRINIILGFSVCVLLTACRLPLSSDSESEDQIYFNSFESAADTLGWNGNGSFVVENSAAPGGGKRSLKVAGGCIIPHARYYLGKMDQDGYLTLKLWGRNLELGGFVALEVHGDRSSETGVSISDTAWKSYTLPEPVYVTQNSDVYIILNSGGIVYSAMLIDLIRVSFTEGR